MNLRPPTQKRSKNRAFTLIELMVAIGIAAVIMTVAIPRLFQDMGQQSMRKAVNDVLEACRAARRDAILGNQIVALRINPAARSFSVGAASSGAEAPQTFSFSGNFPDQPAPAPAAPTSGFSATLPNNVIVEILMVNLHDMTQSDSAEVRFYPNGTSDEMSLVMRSDKNEFRNITLEVVTGLPDVEVDPQKFRER